MNSPDFGNVQDYPAYQDKFICNYLIVGSLNWYALHIIWIGTDQVFLKVSKAASYHTFYENEKYGA